MATAMSTCQVAQIAAEASTSPAQPARGVPERHETALLSTGDALFSIFK